MSLKAQIMADIKTAMKSKQADRLATLRLLNAAIKNKEIELRPKEPSDEDVMAVIQKLVKQRKESIEQYSNANRKDLADKESAELEILAAYLPEPLSEEEVAKVVDEVIQSVGASSMKDMGNVMKQVIAQTQGRADNKIVSQLVKAKLG